MRLIVHPNSAIEGIKSLKIDEKKYLVMSEKGDYLCNIKKDKKDGKIKFGFAIKEKTKGYVYFAWTKGCPIAKIYAPMKRKLVGLAFVVEDDKKTKQQSQKSWEKRRRDSCNCFCIRGATDIY